LATKIRWPSGETTIFQGSAPVMKVHLTLTSNLFGSGFLILIAVTVSAAALAM
jgi:hypothetical protein